MNESDCVPIKCYLQKQVVGGLWPANHRLLTPILAPIRNCISMQFTLHQKYDSIVLPLFLFVFVLGGREVGLFKKLGYFCSTGANWKRNSP